MSTKHLSRSPPVFPGQPQPSPPGCQAWWGGCRPARPSFTTFLRIGTNLFEFSGIEPDNKAEVHKRTRTATAAEPVANRPQTRQLKEAGVSTHSNKVVVATAPPKGQTPPTCDQTNKFKQANETPATKNFENDEIKDCKEADLEGEKTRESPSIVGLAKTRSHGQRACTLRGRGLKNSTKDANGANGTKSAENEADLLADEEIEDNNQSQSCPSFTGSTGDGAVGKRKSGSRPNQKSSRK